MTDEKLDRAKTICLEMMKDRGYDFLVDDDDDILKVTNGYDIVFIFINNSQLNINLLKDLMAILEREKCDHAIVVHDGNITTSATDNVKKLRIKMELFNISELQYNITKHSYVPKHEKLSGNKADEIRKRFGKKFASMFDRDPISRYYDFRKGDIIKITRKNGYVAFRYVR